MRISSGYRIVRPKKKRWRSIWLSPASAEASKRSIDLEHCHRCPACLFPIDLRPRPTVTEPRPPFLRGSGFFSCASVRHRELSLLGSPTCRICPAAEDLSFSRAIGSGFRRSGACLSVRNQELRRAVVLRTDASEGFERLRSAAIAVDSK